MMKKFNTFNVLKAYVLLLVTVSACGLAQDPQNDSIHRMNGLTDAKATAFNGKYESECYSTVFNGENLFEKEQIQFNSIILTHFKSEISLYRDPTCTQILATRRSQGWSQITEKNKRISMQVEEHSLTPLDPGFSDRLNRNGSSFCGHSDWKPNVSRDIVKDACSSSLNRRSYYLNSRNADASTLEFYPCSDRDLSACRKITYTLLMN